MNSQDTATDLLSAARELFVAHGYAGTSIRAITRAAGTNLGAVTYHFGSKEALYGAVAESIAEPLREHIRQVAARPGDPLTRLAVLVRSVFDYLWDHPELPGFMVQHLASSREPPAALRTAVEANLAVLADLIAAGQASGTIRSGDPRLLALSIVAQPIWLALVRRLLRQAVHIDQDRPDVRAEIIETAVRFIHAGIAAPTTEAP